MNQLELVGQLANAILHLKVCEGKGPVAIPGLSACEECVKAAAVVGAALAKIAMIGEWTNRAGANGSTR